MKWRRMLDPFMVIVAGPLGLPYILGHGRYSLETIPREVWGTGLGEIDQGHLERRIPTPQGVNTVLSVNAGYDSWHCLKVGCRSQKLGFDRGRLLAWKKRGPCSSSQWYRVSPYWLDALNVGAYSSRKAMVRSGMTTRESLKSENSLKFTIAYI